MNKLLATILALAFLLPVSTLAQGRSAERRPAVIIEFQSYDMQRQWDVARDILNEQLEVIGRPALMAAILQSCQPVTGPCARGVFKTKILEKDVVVGRSVKGRAYSKAEYKTLKNALAVAILR